MSASFSWSFLNGTLNALNKLDERLKKNTEKPVENQPAIPEMTLTADILKELKWMSAQQLYAIFGGGKKKKAVINNDPAAWKELRWFSADELKAIFGEEGPEDD